MYLEVNIVIKVPAIMIIGPPGSGKHTIGRYIAKCLKCVHITGEQIKNLEQKYTAEDSNAYEKIQNTYLLARTLRDRLLQEDCETQGYVLTGFPETEAQAKFLQFEGIFPDIVLNLQTPDDVLIQRAKGKLIDADTGDIYHKTYNPPSNGIVSARVQPASVTSENVELSLKQFKHNFVALNNIYSGIMTTINTDQPLSDVYTQALCRLKRPVRSIAMWTPRVVLLGFSGSGRKTMSLLLAKRYELVPVHCGMLIRTEILNETKLGKAMSTYVNARVPVPNPMVINVLKMRLSEIDCTLKGWVLFGFPRSSPQAEILDNADLEPNRVLMLNIPHSEAATRLSARRIDAVTGKRYNMCNNPPPADLLRLPKRIAKAPGTEECEISARLARFAAHRDELIKYYGFRLLHVNADQDVHNVFEHVESVISKPLPFKATNL